jgi:hypothetical protein
MVPPPGAFLPPPTQPTPGASRTAVVVVVAVFLLVLLGGVAALTMAIRSAATTESSFTVTTTTQTAGPGGAVTVAQLPPGTLPPDLFGGQPITIDPSGRITFGGGAMNLPGPTTTAVAPGPPALPPSGLARLGPDETSRVDAPGMRGTPAAYDPLANLDWVSGIARAWAADARLKLFYVGGVREDGTADLTGGGGRTASYHFYSPARRAAAETMSRVSETDTVTELMIMVGAAGVRAMPQTGTAADGAAPDLPAAGCRLDRIVALLRERGLPERPHYTLYLSPGPSGDVTEWEWWVSGDAGTRVPAGLPRIPFRNCEAPEPR